MLGLHTGYIIDICKNKLSWMKTLSNYVGFIHHWEQRKHIWLQYLIHKNKCHNWLLSTGVMHCTVIWCSSTFHSEELESHNTGSYCILIYCSDARSYSIAIHCSITDQDILTTIFQYQDNLVHQKATYKLKLFSSFNSLRVNAGI